jgi:hypothetical protein
MSAGLGAALAFVAGIVFLSRILRRREREGHWDKEGHGTPEHQQPGVKFRPLEVPAREPFD